MSTVTTAEITTKPSGAQGVNANVKEETSGKTSSFATRHPPRTIVIAVDGSRSSHRALCWTLDNVVRGPSDKIILATVAAAPKANWSDVMQFWEKGSKALTSEDSSFFRNIGHSYGLETAAAMEERAREFATQTLLEASEVIQSGKLPTSEAFLISHEVISIPQTFMTANLPKSVEEEQMEPTDVPSDEPKKESPATSGKRHPAVLISDICASHDADMLVIGEHEENKERGSLPSKEETQEIAKEIQEEQAQLTVEEKAEFEEEDDILGMSDVGGTIAASLSSLASAIPMPSFPSWLKNWKSRPGPSLQEALTGLAPCPVIVVKEPAKGAYALKKQRRVAADHARRQRAETGASEATLLAGEHETGGEKVVEACPSEAAMVGACPGYDPISAESKKAWSETLEHQPA
ncbi:hypothetical protein HDU97_008813 [Phlyctochytrium planicorne]|nr:hypothetical protein HDU97_008813 [Phlyctochytrium planicorne]